MYAFIECAFCLPYMGWAWDFFSHHMLAAVIEVLGGFLYLDRFSSFIVLLFLGASWASSKQHSWRWSAGYYTDVFFQ